MTSPSFCPHPHWVSFRSAATLKGKVHVLTGGPPCQGFSFAGKQVESDLRNKLFEKYVEMVEAIQPAALVLGNVPGIKVAPPFDHLKTSTGVFFCA
nr:DNA cytosine methyltransferase [Pseudomonas lundensis]